MRKGKVLVVGRGEAGKSTLVKALCQRAMNLEVNGRTVAMDHGTLSCDRGIVHLVGVPGQDRFAAVREALAVGALGAVWVHPAGEDADAETATLLSSLAGTVPYVVFVNHRTDPLDAGFSPPSRLPPPSAVVRGNLARPDDTLPELLVEVCRLIERAWTPCPAS